MGSFLRRGGGSLSLSIVNFITSGGSNNTTIVNLLNPEQFFQFLEDWIDPIVANAAPTSSLATSSGTWFTNNAAGTFPVISGAAQGVLQVRSDGLNLSQRLVLGKGTSLANFIKTVSMIRTPTMQMRFAPRIVNGPITRVGWFSNAADAGDPTAGIYLRYTGAGAYSIVVRNANVETVLPAGINAADQVNHSWKFAFAAGIVTCFLDGLQIGTVGTNVPTVDLGPAVNGLQSNNVGDGIDLDYFANFQSRN